MNKPSDIYPALTDERLSAVAAIITKARHEAAIRHEPELGDNNWTLGCRGYAFQCHGIVSGTVEHSWLTIVEGGGHIETEDRDLFWTSLRFVFAVGGVPLRTYRGDPTDVPTKSLRVTYPELTAKQTVLWGSAPTPHALRLAVEFDDRGEVSQITLVQVLDEEGKRIGETWPITTVEVPANVTPFTPRKEEGTDLGQPAVGSRKKKPEEESGEE